MKKILPFEVERSKPNITAHSGLLLTYESLLGLGLDKSVDRELPRPGSNRGFRPSEYVVSLMLMQHGGGRKLEDLTRLREDETLKAVLNKGEKGGNSFRIPTSDAAGDWLRRMGGNKTCDGRADGLGLVGLERVNRLLCNRLLSEMGIEGITLDVDASIITGEKEEADWTYKGVRGFQPMLGYAAELGICLYDEFRAGNVPAGAGAAPFLEACRKQLTGQRYINAVRSDSAWYQAAVFNWCEQNEALYAIAADQDEAVKRIIGEIADKDWEPLVDKKGIQTDREIAETVHSMEKTEKSFRLIVQRWKLESQETLFGTITRYGYHVIASNRPETAQETVYWYNQRGCCENWIKEEKLGFGTEYLPCGQLGANAMFFRIGLLAYNLFIAMKLLVFPQSYQTRQIQTIRWQIYQWAGYFVNHARKQVLKISAPEEFVDFLRRCRSRCWQMLTA